MKVKVSERDVVERATEHEVKRNVQGGEHQEVAKGRTPPKRV